MPENVTVLPALAYVAGPYRDPRGAGYIRENIEEARRIAVRLWQAGIPTICPHTNTAMMDGLAPDEAWLKGDLEILRRCDVVVLVNDWERSSGARAEVEFAERRGIPVVPWDGDEGYSLSCVREALRPILAARSARGE